MSNGVNNNQGSSGVSTAGTESTLSNWAGPYVTDMLGQGQALANAPYEAYGGPLSAGASGLQQQAFSGIGGLGIPNSLAMGDYTSESIGNYMNPYLEQALQPQVDAAIRNANIRNVDNMGKLNKAGAYGGSRQAVLQNMSDQTLSNELAGIYGTGYKEAFDSAVGMQDTMRGYGLDALQKQLDAGGIQRDIEQEGIEADKAQFEQEYDDPYKKTQFMQSLLQDLPIEARDYINQAANQFLSAGSTAGSFMEFIDNILSVKKD
jgi:hypothetical protein